MQLLITLLFFLLTMTFLSSSSLAQDWSQWRGSNRDGVISTFVTPASWPDRLKLRWQRSVGSGHSSPIVVGEKVYVHTRQREREVVTCLELETGKVHWQYNYPAPYEMHADAVRHGKGPRSTPVLDTARLFMLSISGVLSCLDAHTGKLLWQKDFSGQFEKTSPLYGAATSPLVSNQLCIVHVGGHDDGALVAFDVSSGEEKWRWSGDGPGYASPIVAEIDGVQQLVSLTQQFLVGLALSSGELLWKLPFTTEYDQNIITPVVDNDRVIFSGYAKGTTAIRVRKAGSQWETDEIWHNQAVSMYMSSPLLRDDLLFGFSHHKKGQFFCLDARDGRTLWLSAGRMGQNAGIVSATGLLFFLTTSAELFVVRENRHGFKTTKRYSVANSEIWAHPVIIKNHLLIKDAEMLMSFSLE